MSSQKIIAGKYLVKRENAYFFNEYLSVSIPNKNVGLMMHIPEFASKLIYESIQTSEDCEKILKGKIYWDVRKSPLDGPFYGHKKTDVVHLPRPVYVAFDKHTKKITPYAKPSVRKSEVKKDLGRHHIYYIIKPIRTFRMKDVKSRI